MLHVTRNVDVIEGGQTIPYPSKTYPYLEVGNCFGPLQDYDNALFDACVKRLSTQVGAVRGYPDDYGMDWIEIHNLAAPWAKQILPDRIRACLSVDDRVKIVEVEILDVSADSVLIHLTINRRYSGRVTL